MTQQSWRKAMAGSLGGVLDNLALAQCPLQRTSRPRRAGRPAVSDIHKNDSSPAVDPGRDTGGEACLKITKLFGA